VQHSVTFYGPLLRSILVVYFVGQLYAHPADFARCQKFLGGQCGVLRSRFMHVGWLWIFMSFYIFMTHVGGVRFQKC